MGYTLAMFVASIVFAVPIMLLSAILFGILRWLRAVPAGGAGVPAYLLLVCSSYAVLFLYSSALMLWLQPMQIQRRYLGRVEAGPLSLRSYSHDGFMDPGDSWIYALDPGVAAQLRHHCLPSQPRPSERAGRDIPCYLVSREDARTYTGIWIEQGRLRIDDGLH